jgi:predicted lipoprotein with Yx(FWY)xxD motif
MRTRLLPFAATSGMAVALVLAACSGPAGAGSTSASPTASESAAASSSSSTSATATHEVKVAHTTAGDALVGAGGKTLYWNTTETKSTIVCTGKCAAIWPPFTLETGGKSTAGQGVTAGWLATVTRPDGKTQVTYNGHPLYYFASDTAAGDATGQGISGIWFIATSNGKLPSASASAKATASPSSGYGD